MEKVVIFGTSAAATLSYFCLTHDSPYEVVGFTVDQNYIKEDNFHGLPVVPFEDIETLFPPNAYKMLVAIYASRIEITGGLYLFDVTLPTHTIHRVDPASPGPATSAGGPPTRSNAAS